MSTLERGFAEYLTGIAIGAKSSLGAIRLGTDLQTLIDTHGAVIRVRRIGGTENELEVRPRLAVESYANSYTDVWTAASGVFERMVLPRKFRAGAYLIDYCTNESASAELAHPNLRVLASTWRIVTRRVP